MHVHRPGPGRNEGGYACAYAVVYAPSPDTSGRIYSYSEYELKRGERQTVRVIARIREMAMVRERVLRRSSPLAPCKVARSEDISLLMIRGGIRLGLGIGVSKYLGRVQCVWGGGLCVSRIYWLERPEGIFGERGRGTDRRGEGGGEEEVAGENKWSEGRKLGKG